jgi:hypothetical protein
MTPEVPILTGADHRLGDRRPQADSRALKARLLQRTKANIISADQFAAMEPVY